MSGRSPVEPETPLSDSRHVSPAYPRNRGPIVAVLDRWLPPEGVVLEIASGTGQHLATFADRWPHLIWQPSDIDANEFASIRAWTRDLPNVRDPVRIDAGSDWDVADASVSAVVVVNLLHFLSPTALDRFLAEAARVLAPGGLLAIYGPFWQADRPPSEGDVVFDARLQANDPQAGYKSVAGVVTGAAARGLISAGDVAMPANNRFLAFTRPPA